MPRGFHLSSDMPCPSPKGTASARALPIMIAQIAGIVGAKIATAIQWARRALY